MGKSTTKKFSVLVTGMRTSLTVETATMTRLLEIAKELGKSRNMLLSQIDQSKREGQKLATAVTEFVRMDTARRHTD